MWLSSRTSRMSDRRAKIPFEHQLRHAGGEERSRGSSTGGRTVQQADGQDERAERAGQREPQQRQER